MPGQGQVGANVPVAQPPQIPNMGMSIGMIAMTVDSFSGRESVSEYFEKIELRARLDNWDMKTTVDIVKFRLSGEAYKFLKTDPTLEAANISYDDFKKAFIKRFSPIRIPGEALIKLSRCYQRHDESVANFVTRLKGLGTEIFKEDSENATPAELPGLKRKSEQLVLHQFKSGIKKEYLRNMGTLLMRTENLTIDMAENFARQEELNLVMVNNRQNSGSVLAMRCFKCGMANHMAEFCRNRVKNGGQNRSQNFQRYQYNSRRSNQTSSRDFSRGNQNYSCPAQGNWSANYTRNRESY